MSSAVILMGSRLVMSSMGNSFLCSVILRCERSEPRRMIGHCAAICSFSILSPMGAFVYMLHCCDGSYYVGSATGRDLTKRIAEHQSGAFPGYTYSRRPVELVWSEHFDRITD